MKGLGITGDELFVTGDYTVAGGIPSLYFGIWHFPPPDARLVALAGGNFILGWTSEPNRTCQIHSTTDLSQPFVPSGDPIPSGGTNTSYMNVIGVGTSRYFQIQQIQP